MECCEDGQDKGYKVLCTLDFDINKWRHVVACKLTSFFSLRLFLIWVEPKK